MRLRSLLFVPGDSEHKFAKASGIGADALILDLEDAVAPPRKALAREMVKNLLGGPARDWAFLVRINPLGSGLTLDDLAAIVRPGLDGILIPKVNGMQDIELISNYVDVLEVATGVTPGHVKLLVVATETPAAMIGFAGYATPNRRLDRHDVGRGGSGRGAWRALQQGSRRKLDVSLSGRAGAMPVRGGRCGRHGAGYAVWGFQG